MANYTVEIKETNLELTARARIMLKDTTNAIGLDEYIVDEQGVEITPIGYAILGIHNDKSENKEYEVYVIVDNNNQKYVTGSQSFFSSFMNIFEEMSQEDEEFTIKAYKKPSKNYSGKEFITCSLI